MNVVFEAMVLLLVFAVLVVVFAVLAVVFAVLAVVLVLFAVVLVVLDVFVEFVVDWLGVNDAGIVLDVVDVGAA